MARTLEYQEFHTIPAGIYKAKLTDIEELTTSYGECFKFIWSVVEGDYAGEQVDGLCNQKLGPKAKLTKWALPHLGLPGFEPGYRLNVDDLVGRVVFLSVAEEPQQEGGFRNVISSIAPAEAPRRRPNAPQAAPLPAAPTTAGSAAAEIGF